MTKRARFTLFIIGSTMVVLAFLVAPCNLASEAVEPPPPVVPVVMDAKVTAPEIILKTQKAPIYPPAAKAARFDGVVTVKAHIDKDGKVAKVEVVDCSHQNIGFEEATIAAVKLWEFHPAMLKGEAVAFDSQFRLSFRSGSTGVTTSAHGSSPRNGATPRPPTVSLSQTRLK
jgi:TonB family protein